MMEQMEKWKAEKMFKKLLRVMIVCVFGCLIAAAGCGNDGNTSNSGRFQQASSPAAFAVEDPYALADAADAIMENYLADHQQRTQAYFMYTRIVRMADANDPNNYPLLARAHFGLGLVNFYDIFDVLPTLLDMLGMGINDLLGGLALPQTAVGGAGSPSKKIVLSGLATPPYPSGNKGQTAVPGRIVSAQLACGGVVKFDDYLGSLDALLTNMVKPAGDNFNLAISYDPNVSLNIKSGDIIMAKDDPLTPADESMIFDFSGEWDAGDIGVFSGVLNMLLGVLKIVSSYDGMLQSLINPSFNPNCSPVPGSPEWDSVFGTYGVLNADGGAERMAEAGRALYDGFDSMGYSFAFIASETDDQSDDLIGYVDIGLDMVGPGMAGYTGPDADGTEGNGKYDPGEIWGMATVGDLFNQLLGGALPVSLEQISAALNPIVLTGVMDSLALSVDQSVPVDLVLSLFKPIVEILGGGAPVTDQDLYALGLPALNLGPMFNPPWPSITVIDPLKDATGAPIVEDETATGDITHAWPVTDPLSPYFGRVDPLNGATDPAYSFYPDLDAAGNTVGVFGGLIDEAITDSADFDGGGNLIGQVDYRPMENPAFNALMTTLNTLLGALLP